MNIEIIGLQPTRVLDMMDATLQYLLGHGRTDKVPPIEARTDEYTGFTIVPRQNLAKYLLKQFPEVSVAQIGTLIMEMNQRALIAMNRSFAGEGYTIAAAGVHLLLNHFTEPEPGRKYVIRVFNKQIPQSEPLFLLRAQDTLSGPTVRYYANLLEQHLGSEEGKEAADAVRACAERMEAWPVKKLPD